MFFFSSSFRIPHDSEEKDDSHHSILTTRISRHFFYHQVSAVICYFSFRLAAFLQYKNGSAGLNCNIYKFTILLTRNPLRHFLHYSYGFFFQPATFWCTNCFYISYTTIIRYNKRNENSTTDVFLHSSMRIHLILEARYLFSPASPPLKEGGCSLQKVNTFSRLSPEVYTLRLILQAEPVVAEVLLILSFFCGTWMSSGADTSLINIFFRDNKSK